MRCSISGEQSCPSSGKKSLKWKVKQKSQNMPPKRPGAIELVETEMIDRLEKKKRMTSREMIKHKWIHGPHEAFRAKARHNLFMSISIFAFHNQLLNGYYLEFGSHKARTMRLAWDTFHSLYDWTYVAFDSFEGLPEMDPSGSMPIWKKKT